MSGENERVDGRAWDQEEEAVLDKQATREAMDRLNNSNRVLVESMMLPREIPLKAEQIEAVVDRFRKYTAESGIHSVQVAREVGYSPAVLSSWSLGKYKGDVSAVTHAINDWMERDRRRQQAKRPTDYVKTWIAEDIRTYAYMADRHLVMAAIVAPAGAGKTKVLKALTEEMRGVYVYCDKDVTVRGFLFDLATALGWSANRGSKAELKRFIIQSLTGTKRIVFIDEAHTLGRGVGCLRAIYDQAGVPIVMAGTDEILDFINDRDHGRGQFSSRCITYNAMEQVYNAEGPEGSSGGRDLFTIEEIKAFFAMKRIRIDRDGLKMLWALACLPNHGTLRLAEQIVRVALGTIPEGEILTREVLLAALQMTFGVRAGYLQRLIVRQTGRAEEPAAVAKAG